MSFFSVDVLTPSSVIAKGLPAESLLVQTVRGQINILPHHTHVIEKLDTGLVSLINAGKQEDFIVTTGICKLLDNKVVILANVAERPEKVDMERAKRALEKAKKKITGSENLTYDEFIKYQRKVDRAEIRIKMALRGN
ncbi:MAG: ATP synthase F1 subunit epsilon [Bdellovibrionales bacterium RIFOXYD12_FULL_39_22]|nr:MAG: ATP synthase F1 subunit epsilon [Bdellovibrionales bacterium RIFOXYB1_FULL_39_21]OFZ45188.1 MAG: ATP synthase F1 subunit epsilon [Bdellovibrionales bacterium RIFOXYC12_FULL_39_17]OFZ45620.1 MAG: ATP synthase F1 subunit epsilon [Bdellovibrionales bacterium RIFOXYC1_FULL_39_130]OFZ77482.1 MAG: ATP synthase F1 subunit epsilon [Bdellovibrionales bacterium RIFOXYD1_FULL_39_84]OFZ91611.1 MAG: ATP synthase F1 subunit epsilon [Bdellovibrionales bacterium RIFOXYD12_FULL_39_22]HLE11927.1 ATP syn